MRAWYLHPLFLSLAALLLAAAAIVFSLMPQRWAHAAAPQAGQIERGALILEGDALGAPADSPEQVLHVVRTIWGRTEALRIAVRPNAPPPSPAETGVRVLLTPESAALISDTPVFIDVTIRPLPVTTSSGLAVSLQGIGPAEWISQEISPLGSVARFAVPAMPAVSAIGLRPISENADYAYGVEIVRIRVVPSGAAVQQN